ncbi:MAG: hypothetical protein M9924_20705 [Rhizobiaceae bacterium]|nr:hypothetical protein [Rhizobiaceae bacterium]
MSRYTITVTSDHRSDPDAVIGYDPPLRTFFLQAFPEESGDDLALWLGTRDREYETLDALHAAARVRRHAGSRRHHRSALRRHRGGSPPAAA